MDFKSEFIDFDFDKVLNSSFAREGKRISRESMSAFKEYKSEYLKVTLIHSGQYQRVTERMKDYKTTDTNGDSLYSFTNYKLDNKDCTSIISAQQQIFDNFVDYIKKIHLIQ